VIVNVGVRPGSSLTRVAGSMSSHCGCTSAASATARCKISAVSEGQCSGDCISLRDCPTAVKNHWVLLCSVYR